MAQQSLWYCMQHVLQRSAKRDRWKASRLIYCRRSKPTVLADRLIRKAKPKNLKQSSDKLVFYSDTDKLAFVRRYLEPQLSRAEDSPTSFYILNHGSTFNSVKGGIALDWLTRYPDMSFASQQTLFGIAAVHADRPQLNAFIETRCNGLVDTSETGQSGGNSGSFGISSSSFLPPMHCGQNLAQTQNRLLRWSNTRED